MRLILARIATLLLLAVSVVAWTKDDYEIFDLVSALKADGDGSFYEFLNIEPSATQSQITKAYRKRSLELHPDKNPGVANIQDRFARLGVITAILRDGERRERYDFFLKNGVPTWKGFGYAYTRWRPGLGLVISFLVILTAGLQYVVMQMNHKRDTARVAYFTSSAQRLARGANGRRKVRVPMTEGAQGGESLELVVDDGNVYLPHEDGTLTSLDELAPKPSIKRTWPIALARSLIARVSGKKDEHHEEMHDEGAEAEDFDEVEGYNAEGAPAPRGSRAAQLRKERQKKSRESTPGTTPTGTEGESEADTTDAGAEGKPRRRGPGKANAARRRKMGMKK